MDAGELTAYDMMDGATKSTTGEPAEATLAAKRVLVF